jgi:hypothetical protein
MHIRFAAMIYKFNPSKHEMHLNNIEFVTHRKVSPQYNDPLANLVHDTARFSATAHKYSSWAKFPVS